MRIVVIDGQGGGLGKQIIEAIKKADIAAEIYAVGTNSVAATVMKKAGADKAATGENSVVVACRKADIIVGPVGIAIADSLLGEITPVMSAAVGSSEAKKVLIPMNLCDIIVAGVPKQPVSYFIEGAVAIIKDLT